MSYRLCPLNYAIPVNVFLTARHALRVLLDLAVAGADSGNLQTYALRLLCTLTSTTQGAQAVSKFGGVRFALHSSRHASKCVQHFYFHLFRRTWGKRTDSPSRHCTCKPSTQAVSPCRATRWSFLRRFASARRRTQRCLRKPCARPPRALPTRLVRLNGSVLFGLRIADFSSGFNVPPFSIQFRSLRVGASAFREHQQRPQDQCASSGECIDHQRRAANAGAPTLVHVRGCGDCRCRRVIGSSFFILYSSPYCSDLMFTKYVLC